MGRGAAVILAAVTAATACKRDEPEETDPLAREGDAALVVFVDRAPGGVTFADEAEPNDDVEAAQAVALPSGVRGALGGETDDDFFRLEVEEALQLAAVVSGAEDVDLILDVTDESGERIERSDRAPKGHSEGVPNLSLEPGTYYVKVHEFVRGRERGEGENARTSPSEPYELVLEAHDPESGYEAEPNGEPEEASGAEIDRDAFGFIGWHGDADVWEIPLAAVLETDGLDVEVTGVPWIAPKLEVLGPQGEVLLSREGRRGEGIYAHYLAPHHALGEDAGEAEALFLRISSARSNPEEPYRLSVTRRELEPGSELEPNGEPEAATPLRQELDEMDGESSGHLDVGDVDVYRLGASPGARVLYATVEASPGVRASLEVSVDGEVLGAAEEPERSASATVSDVAIPAGRSAYLTVRGEATDAAGDGYELRWSLQ